MIDSSCIFGKLFRQEIRIGLKDVIYSRVSITMKKIINILIEYGY